MSLFSYLRRRNATASVAKERLQIIISHERHQRYTTDYLPKLKEEILQVIAKYIPISHDKVNFNIEKTGDNTVLEVNVTVPEAEEA